MKILIATDLFPPIINGVATFCSNLAQGLADRGHKVLVVTPSQTGKGYVEENGGYTILHTVSVPFVFYRNVPIFLGPRRRLLDEIRRFQPDVIHVQTFLGVGRAAMAAGKKFGIPVVGTNHALPDNLLRNLRLIAPVARHFGWIVEMRGGRFYNKADYVTSPTQASIDMFKKFAERLDVPVKAISNGIDLGDFTSRRPVKAIFTRYHLPPDKPMVTYVGRLDKEKQVSVLLHACRRVFESVDAHLLIVGSGTALDDLARLSEALDIAGRVTFTGSVPKEDLIQLHRAGHVFCMPSPAELQSIATLEAMASGLPVVAVDSGALYELCRDGENGYLVETGNAQQMAEKLMVLLKDEHLRKQMAQKSLEIAARHDIRRTLEQYEAIYKELAASN